jgi:hypothetical protein
MKEKGRLIIKLDFDRRQVQSVHLLIPELEINQPLARISKLPGLPAGEYSGTIVTRLTDGSEIQRNITLEIFADRETVFELQLIPPSDIRRERRIDLRLRVDYRNQNGQWITTESVNLSSSGLCVILGELSTDHKNVTVRLFSPDGAPVECSAKVRWRKASKKMGLELVLPEEAQNQLKTLLTRT